MSLVTYLQYPVMNFYQELDFLTVDGQAIYTESMPSRLDESDASMRQRLVTSLSQSFPGSALSKALHCMSESDDEMIDDPLSSSCYAELRMEKIDPDEDDDDELTSLTWLQDTDLLKNISVPGDEVQNCDEDSKENGNLAQFNSFPQTHPSHIPYNPQKHINSKPPYSFSCLIFMSIEDSPQKKLPVKDIYNWILTHFPYFQNAPTGWKNSVRHNLSLNKCFKKVDKDRGQAIGKGSLWCIDPDYRPNLLQALRKTPYHPYHQLQMLSNPQPQQCALGLQRPSPLMPRSVPNTPSPHLFPFLSRRLAQSNYDIDSEIQDVAKTLVSLKGINNHSGFSSRFSDTSESGNDSPTEYSRLKKKRKYRTSGPYSVTNKRQQMDTIVCTSNPSEDHTYSVNFTVTVNTDVVNPCSPRSSIDDEYDFGDDDEDDFSDDASFHSDDDNYDEVDGDVQMEKSHNNYSKDSYDADEQQKIVDGADALMNLAGIKTRHSTTKRSFSNDASSVEVKHSR